MALETSNTQALFLEVERLRQELDRVMRENADLEILLEMTTDHSDTIEAELKHQADETVRTSEKRLAQFLEAMPVGVAVLNADGKPYYFNRKAEELFGKGIVPDSTPEQLASIYQIYMTDTHELYPTDRLPIVRALKGENVTVDDLEIHCKGRIIPLEVWGTPVFNDDGEITYAIIAFQDITVRKLAQAEHIRFIKEREAKEVAQRLNKKIDIKNKELVKLNQEKNEFLGIVAHDLKNPLSAIKGYAEEIQEYLDELEKDELLELVNMIQITSHKMFDLVTNLLDVNAIESGKMNFSLSQVDILPTIQELVNYYAVQAEAKNIAVHFKYSQSQYIAFVDKNTVHQVLDNLISNAVKYSHYGKNIFIVLYSYENKVRCEIRDEGPGLTKEDQKKLFGKFSRLTPRPTADEHSTGLGLFIVKKLVEAMEGKVWCESQVDQGANFIVEFQLFCS